MTLAARLAEFTPRVGVCTVAQIADQLDKPDRQALEAAFKSLPASTIAKALTAEGHRVGNQAMRRHMNWLENRDVPEVCCCARADALRDTRAGSKRNNPAPFPQVKRPR